MSASEPCSADGRNDCRVVERAAAGGDRGDSDQRASGVSSGRAACRKAAAAKGNAAAKRMLALIMSRPMPDGSVNIAWMSQLAYLDTASSLPQLDTRAMASMMYRDPTPLFDLLPEAWQRQLTTVPR